MPILGVIDQPILRERWLGVAGARSTLNGAPIATRACADVADAYLYATTPHMFGPPGGPCEAAFNRVRDAGEGQVCVGGGGRGGGGGGGPGCSSPHTHHPLALSVALAHASPRY